MPRFYFNFQNGDIVAKEEEGQGLPVSLSPKKAALVSAPRDFG